jgi:hypothetical protein
MAWPLSNPAQQLANSEWATAVARKRRRVDSGPFAQSREQFQ